MIATLNWIPDDEETVARIEHYGLHEIFYEAASNAHRRGCEKIAEEVGKYLLAWTFKAGRFETGWGSLEQGLVAASVLAVEIGGESTAKLVQDVTVRLEGEHAPSEKLKSRAARGLVEKAESYPHGFAASRIEAAIAQIDFEKFSGTLKRLARLLAPEVV